MSRRSQGFIAALVAGALTGCGSTKSSTIASTASSAGAGGAGALAAEAQSAATGDIPDNQVYLRYRSPTAGYSMLYPEGWTRKGAGGQVIFADKNNVIRVTVRGGGAPTTASLATELARLKRSKPGFTYTPAAAIQLKGGAAVKSTYTTKSAPNPVTGKVVTLVVDRYEIGGGGKVATVDLGTPKGVDTVDAYRMIINSFRWQ